jgi:hypothetical protein
MEKIFPTTSRDSHGREGVLAKALSNSRYFDSPSDPIHNQPILPHRLHANQDIPQGEILVTVHHLDYDSFAVCRLLTTDPRKQLR